MRDRVQSATTMSALVMAMRHLDAFYADCSGDVQSSESAFEMAMRMHTAMLSMPAPRSIKADPYDATRLRTSRALNALSKTEVADDETLLISSWLVTAPYNAEVPHDERAD